MVLSRWCSCALIFNPAYTLMFQPIQYKFILRGPVNRYQYFILFHVHNVGPKHLNEHLIIRCKTNIVSMIIFPWPAVHTCYQLAKLLNVKLQLLLAFTEISKYILLLLFISLIKEYAIPLLESELNNVICIQSVT